MDEDDIHQIKWDEIRDFYREKKQRWAKGKSYYTNKDGEHPEWGTLSVCGGDEPAGYELKPPYSAQEVEDYESRCQIVLPADLKTYLTEVSRELHVTSYPLVFSLRGDGPIGEFKVPEDKKMWDFGDCLIHGHWTVCEAAGEDCDETTEVTDGTVVIGEGGCTDVDWMVVKGTHYGSVWRVGNGGDALFHDCNTFWDYIYKPIQRENERNRPMTEHDLASMAQVYNFLRIMGGVGGLSYLN